ncbi:MAG: (dimethylallyl)adenosine tRNA methylthiotransferase, partial [Rhodococcus erythropolis]|nr:(dimethylallyl)adenosine tRNA methylthiotransferase [Rhodococcus erythropolis]
SFEKGITPKTPPIGVGLGLPKIGAPAPQPVQMGCNA